MLNDLDQLLTESLQERADRGAPIDPARMMRVAVAEGHRIRTRRRVVAAALAFVAVGAIVVAGTLAPRRPGSATRIPVPSASSRASADLGLLPVAAGQPGASGRPDLVATDPRVVHFSVDWLAVDAWGATWTSTTGYESVGIQRDDFQAYVAVSRDLKAFPPSDSLVKFGRYNLSSPVPVTIAGRPGTAAKSVGTTRLPRNAPVSLDGYLWALVWQPVDGLWATVEVQQHQSLERAVQIAESVRFDQAKKCAVPFTVGQPPAGSKLRTCTTRLGTQSSTLFEDGRLVFGDGTKQISFDGRPADGCCAYPRPLKAGPNRVYADPGGGNWTMLMGGVFFDVPASPHNAYTQAQALETLATVRMVAHPGDPSTW